MEFLKVVEAWEHNKFSVWGASLANPFSVGYMQKSKLQTGLGWSARILEMMEFTGGLGTRRRGGYLESAVLVLILRGTKR